MWPFGEKKRYYLVDYSVFQCFPLALFSLLTPCIPIQAEFYQLGFH